MLKITAFLSNVDRLKKEQKGIPIINKINERQKINIKYFKKYNLVK